MRKRLLTIYDLLLGCFGPRHWWPADSPFEVVIGAILTQNTAWHNVEKALIHLKNARLLSGPALREVTVERLAQFIRPAGYYRQKARYIKDFLDFLFQEYGGSLANMESVETGKLRTQLLAVRGIGSETADSMLLYALNRPVFVIDAYTRRILDRLGLLETPSDKMTYDQLQDFFEAHLPRSAALFNEYHALLVNLGKEFCQKRSDCEGCPLRQICLHNVYDVS